MKIHGANNINNVPKINNIPKKPEAQMDKVNPPSEAERNPGAIYRDKSFEISFQTYDLETIEKLLERSENLYGQLKEIVEEIILDQDKFSGIFRQTNPLKQAEILKQLDPLKQAEILKQIEILQKINHMEELESLNGADSLKGLESLKTWDRLEISESLMSQIKELIESEGKLGAEAMSDKIVDFVKVAAGGDPAKIEVLMGAISETFEGVEAELGELSSLSGKTYDRIMEKLDILLSSEGLKSMPELEKLELRQWVDRMLTQQAKVEVILDLVGKENLDNPLMIQVKDLISSQGRLSAENMSGKISELVAAISDGDEKAASDLIRDIEVSFTKLEDILGKLPPLSRETFDMTMEKLETFLPGVLPKVLPEAIKLELSQMMEVMISSQVKTLAILQQADLTEISLNKAAITEAKDLIRPDGLLGVIAMSTQVVQFAKKAAGGDADRLAEIINAIKKNFAEVKAKMGDLPDLSEETYEMIIQDLEEDLLEMSKKGLKFFDKFLSILEDMREREIPVGRYAFAAGGATLLYYGIRILF